MQIAQKEGFLSLYKGLGAVVSGIVPKMAIRFSSFEAYKEWLADPVTGQTHSLGIFMGMFLKSMFNKNSWVGCWSNRIRHGRHPHGRDQD